MAKEIPYFKFFVSEWILGRISDHKDSIQGAFILACCYYWNHQCDYKIVDFERKIGKKRYKKLLELDFLIVKNEHVFIPFLDEQHAEMVDIHEKRVKGGVARAKQVQEQKGKHKGRYIDKDKEEDKDKNKPKPKKIAIPSESEFLDYCKDIKEYPFSDYAFSIKAKYQSWVENGWRDGNDTEIKNWKSKIKNSLPYMKATPKNSQSTGNHGILG